MPLQTCKWSGLLIGRTDVPDGADGEREPASGREVRRKDPVLGVIERAVSNGGDDLPEDKERVAIEVIRRRARHDDRTP